MPVISGEPAAGPADGPVGPADGPAELKPEPRRHLGWHLALAVITVVAVVVLARRLAEVDLAASLRSADRGWVALAIALSALPVLGAALCLVALTPGRLPFWRTAAVQLATSFVNLVTPASAGGLALNVRYLNRRGIPVAAAVATVGIVQTTSVLVTLVLVLGLLLVSDRVDKVGALVPWQALLIAAIAVVVVGVALYLWGRGRAWLVRHVVTPAQGTWPQLRATLTSPGRLAAAVVGHLTVTLGFAGTLGAAAHAFGGSASLVLLTLVVVGSSALTSAVPVPGGIGAAEATLLSGLIATGLDTATGLSAVLLYRLVTFWARVPVGWAFLVQLRRSGDI